MREEVIRNRAELKRKSLERTCILFFSEGGAMGCPGEVIFRSDDGVTYSMNYTFGKITLEDIINSFPILGECSFDAFGDGVVIPEGWNYLSLGMGNHLIIRNDIYGMFIEMMDNRYSEQDLYVSWNDIADQVVKKIKKPKIILSRKGFDSSNGGIASPYFEDGTLLSLPINYIIRMLKNYQIKMHSL